MKRSAVAVVVIALLLVGLLPAVALGAVPGTANLSVASRSVHPGAAREFAITVTNTNLVVGNRANAIRILLPSGSGITNTATAPTPPSGWNVAVTRTSTAQALTYFSASGLSGGSSVTFPFAADVSAPSGCDRSGVFGVSLSADGGATSQPATGNLTTTIRVLELVDGLAATAPAGVTDHTGTAGQSMQLGMAVRNHASSAVTVAPSVTSNGADTITQPAPATVAAGATQPFAVPVTLAETARTSRFTASASTPCAQSTNAILDIVIQARPTIALAADSFSPRTVNTGPQAKTFSATLNKTGVQTLTLDAGSLSFCGNTLALNTPATFNAGNGAAGVTWGPEAISGPDGTCDAAFTFAGVDDNDAPFTTTFEAARLITIDSIAPTVNVGVTLPSGQTAVKNGDRIGISCAIDDPNARIDFVEIRPNVGPAIATTCGGSPTVDFDPRATSFVVAAQVSDAAGNTGGGVSPAQVIDNAVPVFDHAMTLTLRQIRVSFSDNALVSGGCDPTSWSAGGSLVVEVLNDNGNGDTACEQATNSSRVLVLAQSLESGDAAPNVTYTQRAVSRSPARDGAANQAATATVRAIVGIAPPAPDIIEVYRNTGEASTRERAAFDEERYWTRFGGNDLVVEFAGARTGYSVEILDEQGNVLRREPVTFPDSGNPQTRIPIGTVEGEYVRGMRLVNASNLRGDVATLRIVLDQTLPQLTGAIKTAPTTVDVAFSEKLSEGTNFAFDWLPYENVADAEGGRQYYNVDKVSGSGASRTLTVSTFENNGPFGGAEYLLISGNGTRYRDRAGNELADTITNL